MAAPKGNQNAAKGRMWAAAVERALDRRQTADKRVKAIDELADKLLDQCYEGNLSALQELANRLDGKPHQSMDIAHRDSPAQELEDAELLDIAARGRARTTGQKGGKKKPASVH